MIVMFVSYWYGCWFLPTLLVYIDFDFVKLGPEGSDEFNPAGKAIEDVKPISAQEKDDEVPSSERKSPTQSQDVVQDEDEEEA